MYKNKLTFPPQPYLWDENGKPLSELWPELFFKI